MNNMLFLQSKDFFVDEGTKGKVLCNNQKGICLVLFHADAQQCAHCEETIPEFKKLPYRMASIKFGLCNVSKNRETVEMSAQTIAPITYVPYIILYVQGRPLMRYDGERTVDKILEFLTDVTNRLQTNKTFFENKGQMKVESEIPAYTIGIPANLVCDAERGVCYLSYGDAYNKKK